LSGQFLVLSFPREQPRCGRFRCSHNMLLRWWLCSSGAGVHGLPHRHSVAVQGRHAHWCVSVPLSLVVRSLAILLPGCAVRLCLTSMWFGCPRRNHIVRRFALSVLFSRRDRRRGQVLLLAAAGGPRRRPERKGTLLALQFACSCLPSD
jgi:hypothetical protein